MEELGTIEAFSFRMFDIQADEMRLSKFKAPPDVIASELLGQVLEGTEETVSRANLDGNGRYRRVATRWGELK